jgi:hypothetical protein
MSLCSLLTPFLDLLQFQYNIFFFWAPWFGLQVPNAQTLIGGLVGCGTTTTTGG